MDYEDAAIEGVQAFEIAGVGTEETHSLNRATIAYESVLARIYKEDLTGASGIADSMTTISGFMEVA